ncbi:MAG: hypothetical protein V3S79_04840 [Candidatus Thermoplasmatota archaeon]
MKKFLINCILLLIIVNILLINYPTLAMNVNKKESYIHENIIKNSEIGLFEDKIIYNNMENKINIDNEYGIWIYTIFNGLSDEIKLDIDLITFKLMIDGGGWKYYKLSLEEINDSSAGLQFVRTKIFLEEEEIFVDVVQTQFTFETSCNTYKDFEVSLEIRFPFSLLKSKIKSNNFFNFPFIRYNNNNCLNFIKSKIELYSKQTPILSESYFHIRIGYSSPENNEGPNRVETRFFFGRNSILEPRVFRLKILPYDLGREYKLSYFNSYLTIDETGVENFYRTFSVDFEPAVELQITNIPGNGKIRYDFGNSGGVSTKISFKAQGGSLSNIIQSFIIDPLPEYMSFDLTILGERSFKYESEKKYSVKYIMESIEEGNLINLELQELPEIIKAEWGLKLFLLSLSGSGFIDLDMSSDLGSMALSLADSEKPFIEINNFPQKLRVDGFIDVPNLQGSIQASKYLGQKTIINIPLIFDKWEIIGTIYINNGYGAASFNLPDSNSDHVSLGFDTNNDPLLGLGLTVNDLDQNQQVLYIAVDAIATDDLFLSFDYISSEINNLQWSGRITELIDLEISIDYQGIGFNLATSWIVGEQGLFVFEINKEISIDLNQIDLGEIELDGKIGIYPGTILEVEWERGKIGYINIQTDGIELSPEIELNFLDKNSNEVFLFCSIIMNPNCILKFDWEWGETGYFTIFTNDIIEDVYIEIGYNYDQNLDEFKYGFKITGSDINVIRTIQWDTENGIIPRIWILGDDPIPGNWDVWLLWQYQWYEVK